MTNIHADEWEYKFRPQNTDIAIYVNKAGGGTVGKEYEGSWSFIAVDESKDNTIVDGGWLKTGRPHNHLYVAYEIYSTHLPQD